MKHWDLSITQEHRGRLLHGMAQSVADKGYAETTIADVVREASVSRRTFYEQFSDKAECFIALYEAASHNVLQVLRDAIDPSHGWEEQLERALGAYLGAMASSPVLMRTLFTEILALGAQGLEARRRVNRELAEFMLAVVNEGGAKRVSAQLAMAVVGGIHELVLQAIEEGRVAQLPALTGTAAELVKAVVHRAG
ncbi:TetR/AcrR family transcriptional regulator [Ramlibacter sp.]|uniref:TetR/AcrR family transcriptional regulator n=1 Tax=Ramlibacter sp. TaxID=1917967 RepID=UPI002619ED19|nr:TetR/AcrR family transcriptional regulator [Ramlibacter sp.]MDB5956007.1 transcriptional regulator, TetR family-like protein [Ramlibacter sp.]